MNLGKEWFQKVRYRLVELRIALKSIDLQKTAIEIEIEQWETFLKEMEARME